LEVAAREEGETVSARMLLSPRMTRPLKTSITVAAIAVVLLGLAAAPAAAKKPSKPACWKVLINDWYDGTIHGKYGLRCYRDALEHLRGDTYALGYTDAYDQINHAYHLRRAELTGVEGPSGDSAGPTGKGPGSVAGPRKGRGQDGNPPAEAPPGSTLPGRDTDSGPAQDAIKSLGPDDATSIPIPLIVLAGIAVLLIAAGAASLIARRARIRRAAAPMQPAPPAGGS
jgi:hypothetical protein